MVHVGTEEEARERGEHVRSRQTGFIYEVRLKPGIIMADAVYPDVHNYAREKKNDPLPDRFDEQVVVAEHKMNFRTLLSEMYDPKVSAIRYVNRFESSGSVSLLVDPSMLEVVNRREA